VDQEKKLNGIKKAAKAFTQSLEEALRNILAVPFAVDLERSFVHNREFATRHRSIVCLPFTGVVNGEFFLCFTTAEYLEQMSTISGSPAQSPENHELLFSTMQEVVNIAAGEAMVAIKETFGAQTMLAPRLIEGVIHYPQMQVFSSVLESSDKKLQIDAKLSLDLMEQEINVQQQKLQEKSILDDTGLYNKKHFFDILKEMEEKSHRGAYAYTIVFTDINRLKYVNDNLGHDAGDAFILKACSLLKQSELDGDLTFRIGGDELVMVLPGKTLEQAQPTLKRLDHLMESATIQATNVTTKQVETVVVHLSVGAASSSEGLDTADKVLKQADLRMEHDKRQWYIDQKIDRRK
jgi:diguanylate cyclase (GGDEF)-like protein